MTKQELSGFILKLLGVYALIQSLPQLQNIGALFGVLAGEGDELSNAFLIYIGMTLPFVLMLLAGIALLVFGRSLGKMLFRKDSDSEITYSVKNGDFQAIGFSIVAVLICLHAIPRLVQLAANLWQLAGDDIPHNVYGSLVRGTWQVGIVVFIQIGLAFLLFLKPTGLANLWKMMQQSRHKDIEKAEQDSPVNQRPAAPASDD